MASGNAFNRGEEGGESRVRWNRQGGMTRNILLPCINYQIDTCKISFLHSHSESYFVRNETLSKKLKTYLFTTTRRRRKKVMRRGTP